MPCIACLHVLRVTLELPGQSDSPCQSRLHRDMAQGGLLRSPGSPSVGSGFSRFCQPSLSPPSTRRPIPHTPAPQAQPNQHGGGGAEGGAPAEPEGELQRCGQWEPRAAPLQPDGQQCPQPQQSRNPGAAEGQREHPCEWLGLGLGRGRPPEARPAGAPGLTFFQTLAFPIPLPRPPHRTPCYIRSLTHSFNKHLLSVLSLSDLVLGANV